MRWIIELSPNLIIEIYTFSTPLISIQEEEIEIVDLLTSRKELFKRHGEASRLVIIWIASVRFELLEFEVEFDDDVGPRVGEAKK